MIEEANALVGFSVNGKDYFYDRDILGNINAVIDSTGTKLVSYAYGDFGEVTETIADIDEARLAAKVNPFKFKGYFFDNEDWVSITSSLVITALNSEDSSPLMVRSVKLETPWS